MALVLIAMALTPSHRAELWTSVISMVVALLAFVFSRRRAGQSADTDVARSPQRPVPGTHAS
jgi:hypothetical protein